MGTTSQVVTRIAPSPTGLFHIGTARSALFNWLYAQKYGGRFLIRIEDTDLARSTTEFENDILDGLAWLGLTADAIVRQSDRIELYTDALDTMLKADAAYVSKEPARDDPTRTVELVRLRNPGRTITFHDKIRGDITFDTAELGDFAVARSRTDPLYHLAVVVDDAALGVTHVIRGEDHISNTPRQILIQEALGYVRPVYAHLPLILAPDKSKLSKRKGAVSVSEYHAQGFLPEAIVNYLALLGWNPGTDQEVFTVAELIQLFSLEQVQKGGAVFDIEKLKWLNREHRSRLPEDARRALIVEALPHDAPIREVLARCPAAVDDILERYSTVGEFLSARCSGDFSFYENRPEITRDMLVWRKDSLPENTPRRLNCIVNTLQELDVWSACSIKEALWEYAEEEGKGNVLWPMRMALSGKERSPDPFLLAEALGKEETLARLKTAHRCFV